MRWWLAFCGAAVLLSDAPRLHHDLVYIMTFFIGVVYMTFPLYTHYAYMKPS